jgi:hypothetical protein
MPDFNIQSLVEFVLLNARAIQIAQLAGSAKPCF